MRSSTLWKRNTASESAMRRQILSWLARSRSVPRSEDSGCAPALEQFSQTRSDAVAAVAHAIATLGWCEQLECRRDEREDIEYAAIGPRRGRSTMSAYCVQSKTAL